MNRSTLPNDLIRAAQACRDAGDWPAALRLFGAAAARDPEDGRIQHNIALGHFALGRPAVALHHAEAALCRAPLLWQSHALTARIHRAVGDVEGCAAGLHAVLAIDPGNATARLGLADLDLNEFGDAGAAVARVAELGTSPAHVTDAELTTLMARLYDRDGLGAEVLSQRLMAFSAREFRLAPLPRRPRRAGRLRIGLLSPLLSASPVHALTYSTFAALAPEMDLVAFNRGRREDWATAEFRAICRDWHDVQSLEAEPLAGAIACADIDVLFDLGGWSDPVGLKALSARPARRIVTWVGGQSATTGLDTIDAWIGDEWQNPAQSDALYTEPVWRIGGGYVDYTPPPLLSDVRRAQGVQRGVVIAGNPVKIGSELMRSWPAGVRQVTLLDRRYRHARTRARVTALLENAGVTVEAVIAPEGHAAYLQALAGFATMVDTRPYGAGLTAVEGMALGLTVLSAGAPGRLFSERHQQSHARTHGRNPRLAAEISHLVIAMAARDRAPAPPRNGLTEAPGR